MKVFDISDLRGMIDNFLADGFTLDCLSRGTDTPLELLEECVSNTGIELKEPRKFARVFSFLITMYEYTNEKKDGMYFKDTLHTAEHLFGIPKAAVGKFLGLREENFNTFLENPEAYPNGFQIAVEMLRMLTLFSIEERRYRWMDEKEEDEKQIDYTEESIIEEASATFPIYMEKIES